MIRSLALGLVLATGALAGKLPPGEGQTPPFAVVQRSAAGWGAVDCAAVEEGSFREPVSEPTQNPPDADKAAELVER